MKPRKINSPESKIRVISIEREAMEVEDLRKAKNGLKKSRMFFFLSGSEMSTLENPPHREYRKIITDILETLGLDPEMKFHWDRLAGNAAEPTLPGFVLDGDFNHNICILYADAEEAEGQPKEDVQVVKTDGFVIFQPKEVEVENSNLEGLEVSIVAA